MRRPKLSVSPHVFISMHVQVATKRVTVTHQQLDVAVGDGADGGGRLGELRQDVRRLKDHRGRRRLDERKHDLRAMKVQVMQR